MSVETLPAVFLPAVSVDRYSELSGIPRGVLDGWIKRGYLPVIHVGTRTLVNLAAFAARLASDEVQP